MKKITFEIKLKTGEVVSISDDDIQEIANGLLMEMIKNKASHVFMLKDTAIAKCNLLYKIVTEQKDSMSAETKEKYFKIISEIINDKSEYEIESLEKKTQEIK